MTAFLTKNFLSWFWIGHSTTINRKIMFSAMSRHAAWWGGTWVSNYTSGVQKSLTSCRLGEIILHRRPFYW